MPNIVMLAVVFGSLAAAVLLGRAAAGRLRDRHLTAETRDTIKLSLGLVATLAALLLGLLVSSAKNTFDVQRKQVNELAAEIATLQRVLDLYGEEANAAREGVRATVIAGIARAWSAPGERAIKQTQQEHGGNELFFAIQQLQPKNA